MKNRIVINIVLSCIISSIFYLLFNIWIALIILFITNIYSAFLIFNRLVKRTNWYKNQYHDLNAFLREVPSNLDIVNLGSTSGKFSFEYDMADIKGQNWAIGPQSLLHDYNILKNYFSYIKKTGFVLITVCPFSCLSSQYNKKHNLKYYLILHPATILNFEENQRIKAFKFRNTPLLLKPIDSVIHLIKDSAKNEVLEIGSCPLSDIELKKNAELYIKNWRQQFNISDFEANLSITQIAQKTQKSKILHEMIEFCIKKDLRPIICLPPVTNYLSANFNEIFMKNYILDFVQEANSCNIPFLNYFNDKEFKDDSLYYNALLLNKRGRILFTKRVLEDINILYKI